MFTGNPLIQAAVNWTAAGPDAVPSGTRISTRYVSTSPGHPIALIACAGCPFTTTSSDLLQRVGWKWMARVDALKCWAKPGSSHNKDFAGFRGFSSSDRRQVCMEYRRNFRPVAQADSLRIQGFSFLTQKIVEHPILAASRLGGVSFPLSTGTFRARQQAGRPFSGIAQKL
jgi:hypothetical protein